MTPNKKESRQMGHQIRERSRKKWTKRNSSGFAMCFDIFSRMYCLDCPVAFWIDEFFFPCVQFGACHTDVLYRSLCCKVSKVFASVLISL